MSKARVQREVISFEQMEDMLMAVKGCTALSLDMESEPRMNKGGNPFYNQGVRKCVTLKGLVGLSYSNTVNNELGRENKELDFIAKSPVWFEYLPETKIVGTNKNKRMEKLYMAMKVQSASKPIYKNAMGEAIEGKDLETLKSFLPKASKPKTQSNLEEEIIWRTVTLRNIQVMRILGTEFIIVEHDEISSERERLSEREKQEAEANEANITANAFNNQTDEQKKELIEIREASRSIRKRIIGLLSL